MSDESRRPERSLPTDVPAVAAPAHTVSSSEQFRWQQLIAPGALLATGTFGVYNTWYREHVNAPIRSYAQQLSGGRQLHFDNYIQYIPIISFVGLGFGVPSEHDFTERFCIAATAYAAEGLLTTCAKHTFCEPRPDSDARNAFPSGHTATAFMGAELVRREYGGWWGVGAYAIATTTALMRVYNDRHWSNDLLGGAAIGILSADIGYWLLPLERRLFRLDSRGARRNGSISSHSGSNSSTDRRNLSSGRSSSAAIALLPTPYGLSFSCVF